LETSQILPRDSQAGSETHNVLAVIIILITIA